MGPPRTSVQTSLFFFISGSETSFSGHTLEWSKSIQFVQLPKTKWTEFGWFGLNSMCAFTGEFWREHRSGPPKFVMWQRMSGWNWSEVSSGKSTVAILERWSLMWNKGCNMTPFLCEGRSKKVLFLKMIISAYENKTKLWSTKTTPVRETRVDALSSRNETKWPLQRGKGCHQ